MKTAITLQVKLHASKGKDNHVVIGGNVPILYKVQRHPIGTYDAQTCYNNLEIVINDLERVAPSRPVTRLNMEWWFMFKSFIEFIFSLVTNFFFFFCFLTFGLHSLR